MHTAGKDTHLQVLDLLQMHEHGDRPLILGPCGARAGACVVTGRQQSLHGPRVSAPFMTQPANNWDAGDTTAPQPPRRAVQRSLPKAQLPRRQPLAT